MEPVFMWKGELVCMERPAKPRPFLFTVFIVLMVLAAATVIGAIFYWS